MKIYHARFNYQCFQCGQTLTLYHLNFQAIMCIHCKSEISLKMFNNDNVTLEVYSETN